MFATKKEHLEFGFVFFATESETPITYVVKPFFY